jgi:hypothetical protein
MNPRKQIGNAIWLYRLLVQFAPENWTGAPTYVAGGRVISDAELEATLEVKPRTISVWRRKLKAAGLLDWLLKPGEGRVYVIVAVAEESKFAESKPAEALNSEPQPQKEPEWPASPLVH